jgi:hypothetical protein
VTEPAPLGHLVAALTPHAEVAGMTHVLTATLAGLLPARLVRVERRRSLADRVGGRPGIPVAVTVLTGEHELALREAATGTVEATIAHSVRGVVLSRRSVPITEWITALATHLQRLGEQDQQARHALDRLLLG